MQLTAYTASSVMELLQSLTSSNSSSANSTRSRRESSDPFADMFGGTAMSGNSTSSSLLDGFAQISPATIDALLAAQSKSLADLLPSAGTSEPDVLPKDPFSQLDADGDGLVTKAEFEKNAAGAVTSSYKVMEQMIARQMQAFATSSSAWMRF